MAKTFIIGVGGTGAQVVTTFLQHFRKNPREIGRVGDRFAAVVLDISPIDIEKLQSAKADLLDALKREKVPQASERVTVDAFVLRPPPNSTLREIVTDWPNRRPRDRSKGMKLPPYRPFLEPSDPIDPFTEGVGRRRAFSKLILHHHLGSNDQVKHALDRFGQAAGDAKIWVVYGLGGGTGSGMVSDVVHYLREPNRIGADHAIYGIAMLPCRGDDNPVHRAAFASLIEHEAMVDGYANKRLATTIGERWENLFTHVFLVPLDPAFLHAGEKVPKAQQAIDDALVHMLLRTQSWDFSDVNSLHDVGADTAKGEWISTLTPLTLLFPLRDYFESVKAELHAFRARQRLDKERQRIFVDPTTDVSTLAEVIRAMEDTTNAGWNVFASIPEIREGSLEEKDADSLRRMLETRAQEDAVSYARSKRREFEAFVRPLEDALSAIAMGAHDTEPLGKLRATGLRVTSLMRQLPDNGPDFLAAVDAAERDAALIMDQQGVRGQMRMDIEHVWLSARLLYGHVEKVIAVTVASRRLSETRALLADSIRELDGLRGSLGGKGGIPGLSRDEVENKLGEARRIEHRLCEAATQEKGLAEALVAAVLATAQEAGTLDDVEVAASEFDMKLRREIPKLESEARAVADEEIPKLVEEAQALKDRLDSWRAVAPWNWPRTRLRAELDHLLQEAENLRVEVREMEDHIARRKALREAVKTARGKLRRGGEYRKLLAAYESESLRADDIRKRIEERESYFRPVKPLAQREHTALYHHAMEGNDSITEEDARLLVDVPSLTEFVKRSVSRFGRPSEFGLSKDYKTTRFVLGTPRLRDVWAAGEVKPVDELKSELQRHLTKADNGCPAKELSEGDPEEASMLIIAPFATREKLHDFHRFQDEYEAASRPQRHQAHSLALDYGLIVGPMGSTRSVAAEEHANGDGGSRSVPVEVPADGAGARRPRIEPLP